MKPTQTLIILSVFIVPLCWSVSCLADVKTSTHPNKQQTELPSFNSEIGDGDFELPPITDEESGGSNALGLTIRLNQVVFNGNTVLTDEALQSLAQPYLHHAIDVGELEALRFKVTQAYIQQGFVNSGALIPSQSLKEDVLNIDIVEGQLNEINVEGQGWLHEDYIRARLWGGGPFNVKDLQQRYALLLNDPLIKQLNANYKPLPGVGQSALDINVTRARPYQVAVHYNNFNPPSIGAEQIQAEGWVRNLTRWGDKLSFSYSGSDGADSFAGGFSLPLTAQNTLLSFDFAIGRSSVIEEPLANIDIQSEVRNYSWTLSHPVYRDAQQSLTLGASFASRRSQTSLLGRSFSFITGLDSGRSKVSVLRFFQEYMARLENHVLAFRSTFNVGIDAFDSTIQKGDSLQDSEFLSWLGQLQYAYKLNDEGAQLRLRSNLQLSDQTILPQERMAVGGHYSVRGYRENEMVRDNGYTGSLELHYPIFSTSGRFANRITLIPFMDYGLGWNYHDKADELHSVGIGLNWQAFGYINAEIYYAHDLIAVKSRKTHNIQDDGIHFNVSFYGF